MKAARSHNGQVEIVDIPVPAVTDQSVLVRTEYSALSMGTELMLLRKKMDTFLGYSGTGIVMETGSGVSHVQVGQRIACYGVPVHSEFFLAYKHHVIPLPEHVDPREAAFAGIASIAVHALRQADLRFGETVVVLGLGIVGQLIVQIAHAAAYQVVAFDLLEDRCRMAEQGAKVDVCRNVREVDERVRARTGGKGADCVLICSSSKQERLIDRGLEWIRDRGKIVIVGDTDTQFERDALFAKEAQITISRAGGPGRYDEAYEQEGYDYPYGFVRWTLARNLAEYVRLLAEGRLNVRHLITGQYSLEELAKAYREALAAPDKTLGVLIGFDRQS